MDRTSFDEAFDEAFDEEECGLKPAWPPVRGVCLEMPGDVCIALAVFAFCGSSWPMDRTSIDEEECGLLAGEGSSALIVGSNTVSTPASFA